MQLRPTLRPFAASVAILAAASLVSCTGDERASLADVVVYGGTPAGVAAAVAAAEEGADVTLLAEGSTVGGMMSNGISASDIGSPLTVQGYTAEFFDRVRDHYDDPKTWRFEPHVAEEIHRDLLHEAGVKVRYGRPLASAEVENRMIRCLTTEDGDQWCARTFVDASYTGDLIAAADVPHRLGMGDLREHGDELAESRHWREVMTVSAEDREAADRAFELNPYVRTAGALPEYEDAYSAGMPSLAYRLCVTKEPDNRVRFAPAANYADLLPSFRLLMKVAEGEVQVKSNGTLMSSLYHLAVLPEGKYDLNAGRMSITNLPAPADYFEDREKRQRYNEELRGYVESFFHFAQTDDSVPDAVRENFEEFGLCADEFTDNGNWPREPYVREARRIEGRYTFAEEDIFTSRQKSSSVALGSYNVDGKMSQVVYVDGTLYKDFGMHATAPAYEIPFAVMVPEEGSVLNMLAPIGVSSSPVAYGSLRMEPQYMALGEAAGVAAVIANGEGKAVASVSPTRIQEALGDRGVLFKVRDVCRETPKRWRSPGGFTADCKVLPVEPVAVGR